MGELGQLVRSAGGEVIGEVTQNIDHPTSVYVGHGKLEEIKESRADSRYTVVSSTMSSSRRSSGTWSGSWR